MTTGLRASTKKVSMGLRFDGSLKRNINLWPSEGNFGLVPVAYIDSGCSTRRISLEKLAVSKSTLRTVIITNHWTILYLSEFVIWSRKVFALKKFVKSTTRILVFEIAENCFLKTCFEKIKCHDCVFFAS